MAEYQKVIEMLGDNFASFLELVKKLFVDWAVNPKQLLHMLQNIRKADLLGLIAGTHEIKAIALLPVNSDYKPIKKGIAIEAQERNRQEILSDSYKYVLGDNFKNKILAKCKNRKTEIEILREDELLKNKKDKEITKEMKISEITPDQIAERIIQLDKIDRWIIIGYCNGLVVHAYPYDDGRVLVGANQLGAWDDGYCLLSSDIEIWIFAF